MKYCTISKMHLTVRSVIEKEKGSTCNLFRFSWCKKGKS